MKTKDILRKKVGAELRTLSRRARGAASRGIIRRLRRLAEYVSAGSIFCFVSKADEPDTIGFLKAEIAAGKRKIFVPRVSPDGIEAVRIKDMGELTKGHFGILEPRTAISAGVLPSGALIMVPGLAFDLRGMRLGRGKGYYDRFLRGRDRNKIVGIVFDDFLFERIPSRGHDVKSGAVVTDKRIVLTIKK